MEQRRIESLIEALINIGSGFFIALSLWVFVVAPVWGLRVSMVDNLAITGMFTVVSVIRSYFWRRFFNAGLHRAVHRLAGAVLR